MSFESEQIRVALSGVLQGTARQVRQQFSRNKALKELQLPPVPFGGLLGNRFSVRLWSAGFKLTTKFKWGEQEQGKFNATMITVLTEIQPVFLNKCSSDCYKLLFNFQSSGKLILSIVSPSFLIEKWNENFWRYLFYRFHSCPSKSPPFLKSQFDSICPQIIF